MDSLLVSPCSRAWTSAGVPCVAGGLDGLLLCLSFCHLIRGDPGPQLRMSSETLVALLIPLWDFCDLSGLVTSQSPGNYGKRFALNMGFSANGYFQFFRLWLCSVVTTAVSHKYRLNHSRAAGPALGWRQCVDGLETVFCPQPGSMRSGSPLSRPGPGGPQQPCPSQGIISHAFPVLT